MTKLLWIVLFLIIVSLTSAQQFNSTLIPPVVSITIPINIKVVVIHKIITEEDSTNYGLAFGIAFGIAGSILIIGALICGRRQVNLNYTQQV